MQDEAPEDDPQRRRIAVALFLVVLAVLGPFVAEFSAQTAARYSLSAAIVEDGTVRLDAYDEILLPSDRSERDGHLYSDKPPLQPLLGAPLYAAARAVGAEPAVHERIEGNLGAWWVTLWTSTVPAAVLCSLMFLAARRRFPATAASAALGLSFGSLLLVFSTQMYGHLLSATLGFSAWLLVDRATRRSVADQRRALLPAVAAGALAGAAVTVEYTLVIVALVCLVVLARSSLRSAVAFVAGGVPFAVLLLVYNTAAHGGPFANAYTSKPAFEDSPTIVGLPDPSTGFQALLGSRGLLVLTPVVLVALAGVALLLRERHAERRAAVVSLVVLGALLVVQAGWPNPWGGDMPGPRYFIPALPFLAVPLARAWERWRTLARATAVIGGTIMSLGVLTLHLVPLGEQVVPYYLDLLDVWGTTPTLFTLGIGPAGWAVHLIVAGAAVQHLRTERRRDPLEHPTATTKDAAPVDRTGADLDAGPASDT